MYDSRKQFRYIDNDVRTEKTDIVGDNGHKISGTSDTLFFDKILHKLLKQKKSS